MHHHGNKLLLPGISLDPLQFLTIWSNHSISIFVCVVIMEILQNLKCVQSSDGFLDVFLIYFVDINSCFANNDHNMFVEDKLAFLNITPLLISFCQTWNQPEVLIIEHTVSQLAPGAPSFSISWRSLNMDSFFPRAPLPTVSRLSPMLPLLRCSKKAISPFQYSFSDAMLSTCE